MYVAGTKQLNCEHYCPQKQCQSKLSLLLYYNISRSATSNTEDLSCHYIMSHFGASIAPSSNCSKLSYLVSLYTGSVCSFSAICSTMTRATKFIFLATKHKPGPACYIIIPIDTPENCWSSLVPEIQLVSLTSLSYHHRCTNNNKLSKRAHIN